MIGCQDWEVWRQTASQAAMGTLRAFQSMTGMVGTQLVPLWYLSPNGLVDAIPPSGHLHWWCCNTSEQRSQLLLFLWGAAAVKGVLLGQYRPSPSPLPHWIMGMLLSFCSLTAAWKHYTHWSGGKRGRKKHTHDMCIGTSSIQPTNGESFAFLSRLIRAKLDVHANVCVERHCHNLFVKYGQSGGRGDFD